MDTRTEWASSIGVCQKNKLQHLHHMNVSPRGSPVIDRLKSPKTNCSQPLEDHGLIKIQFWWSCCPIFYDAADQPSCYYFPQKFKPQVSAKHWCVDKCVQTAGAPCLGWSKQQCKVHSQSTLCFVAGVNQSWTECELMIINHSTAAVAGLITFYVLFATTVVVFFSKSSVLLFLHHLDTVSYQNLVSRTLCPMGWFQRGY